MATDWCEHGFASPTVCDACLAKALEEYPDSTNTMAMFQLYLQQCCEDMNGYSMLAAMMRIIVESLHAVAHEGVQEDPAAEGDLAEWVARAVRGLADHGYSDIDAVRWARGMNERY
jgi:hypothetical protein